ncbi:hypothetical protein QYE76_006701 [Lolium multiflorum]|uniref:Glycosyltransferase n=1 Tax=Lolium multiflorum TaxID=4521 RepID=A0AAD8W4M1_LOLMU|nr:hypothetical protein QYE76_006701 [Lolium multiflorum]
MVHAGETTHVLLVPYPAQGHLNPILQFGKRLAAHAGVRCTVAATRFVVGSTKPSPGSVRVAVFSDGCDGGGPAELGGHEGPYFERLEAAGSETLDELLRSEAAQGRPVRVVVYDTFMPWVVPLARRHGAACAAFLTQTCAVDVVYTHARSGRVPVPMRDGDAALQLAGLQVRLAADEVPGVLTEAGDERTALRNMLMNQFAGLDKVDHVLVNSFHDLEPQEAEYLASTLGARTIGPTVPSAYLDNRLPDDVSYGFHLHTPMTAVTKAWLDAHPPRSVVYASFGSIVAPGPDQMAEVAEGLCGAGSSPFLWVVRATETAKLPEAFAARAAKRGDLIVPWCPQLEVLAHGAVGCFVTHCGWNSTVEALSAGVPMVAVPQFSDQPTNAKYIEDVWRVGVRARPDAGGVVRKGEVERCVREVMGGEGTYMIKAAEWRKKAKAAVSDGGSSDRNIADFLSKYRAAK